MKCTVAIIDDERNSRDSLQKKILQYCNELEIIAICESGEEGLEKIELLKPNIVFLDVEMPRMNGFTMLQKLKTRQFELIFTTAYDHYAIRAIRFSALDYLVKPIEAEDLKEAVARAVEKIKHPASNERIETLLHNLLQEKNRHQKIALSSLEGFLFVEIDQIIYLEAKSNYTEVYLKDQPKITISKTLKDCEEVLSPAVFIRIHHSYMINRNHIQKYIKGEGGQVIMSNGQALDVARRRKEEFMRQISK
jgi:two-component system LytT family response regulator